MPERKSPPGPREMVQEHKVINSFSGIQFEEEVAPQPTPPQKVQSEDEETPRRS